MSVPSSGVLYVAMVSDGADLVAPWTVVTALDVVVAPVAEPPPQPASAPPAMASAPIAQNVDIRFTFIPLVGFVRAHDARRASLRKPKVVVRNVSPDEPSWRVCRAALIGAALRVRACSSAPVAGSRRSSSTAAISGNLALRVPLGCRTRPALGDSRLFHHRRSSEVGTCR